MPSKSAKYKSQALAQAKKALSKFSGELANPIRVSDWPGLAGPIFMQRAIWAERSAKLELLLTHYRIHPNDKDRWIKLAACLTADLVPGMIAIKVPAKQLPARKDREWTLAQYSELVGEVDELVATGEKLYNATRSLAHETKWARYGGDSLKTRYHEGKRLIKKMAKLKAVDRPLWTFPKT